jgi:hypothetical protein
LLLPYTFGGLLAIAHERGLVSLKADFITVTAELALAHAIATFTDGRTFEESADATPANVNSKIRPHFPRLALTRAKARALCAVKAAYLECANGCRPGSTTRLTRNLVHLWG